MLRIGIIADQQTPPPVKFYRTTGPLRALESQMAGAIRVEEIPQHVFIRNELAPLAYDIILIECPINPGSQTAVQMCKDMGRAVWIDYDDNLFSIPRYNGAKEYFNRAGVSEIVQKCMALADIITVSTDFLKRLYSGINSNITVVPNAWDDFTFSDTPEIQSVNKPIRLAWRGSNKHRGDLYDIKSTIGKYLKDPAFDWAFLGDDPFWLDIHPNQYRGFSTLFSYFKAFFTSGVDFLIVPLQINDFNKAKSNCSWIEATLAGAVTIAPMGLPEFDKPGVIRYKDNRHLDMIFKDIKAGKYDKQERVQASREALEEIRLSKVNAIRGGILAGAFGLKVEEKVNTNLE